MELQYYGANCVRITTKQASVVIDDNLSELGLKSQTKSGDIAVFTGAHGEPATDTKIIIDQPGEFEVSGMSVVGLSARAHMDEEGSKTATVFKLVAEDIKVLITGHIYPDLTEQQLETIGLIDVMIIPVGGNGYTLDGIGALKIIKKVEPKLIIPVHFADKGVSYSVPQQELKEIIHALGMEAKLTTTKLKLKSSELIDSSQLIILERQ
jgi:L-ascorbate metabolism protein UlaG (beta-lactamase superfamily)